MGELFRWPRTLIVPLMVFGLWLVWGAMPLYAAFPHADAGATGEEAQWLFFDEGKPGAPPSRGSWLVPIADAPSDIVARFALSSTMQALSLHLISPELSGVRLADLNALDYCTRMVDGMRPDAVMLQISVDVDVTDTDVNWQGRLVYVPAYNGAVVQGEWQCWRTLAGKWWATGGLLAALAPATSPQPLQVLLARYPNLGLHPDVSPLVLKAGDGWTRFVGEATPVLVGRGDARTIYAFGEAATPSQVWVPVVMQQPVANTLATAPATPQPAAINPDTTAQADQQDKDKEKDKAEKDKDKKDKDKKAKSEKKDRQDRDDDDRDDDDRQATVGECRSDGWSSLGFRNQGQCVAYYNRAANRGNDDDDD